MQNELLFGKYNDSTHVYIDSILGNIYNILLSFISCYLLLNFVFRNLALAHLRIHIRFL